MTVDILLHQLRERLRLIEQRSATEEEKGFPFSSYSLVAFARVEELHSEAAFLVDLIGQVEQGRMNSDDPN